MPQVLKYRRSIDQPIQHHQLFKMTPCGEKQCVPFVSFADWNVVVRAHQVHFVKKKKNDSLSCLRGGETMSMGAGT